MNIPLQAPAGDPYRPRHKAERSGTFTFNPDFLTADGWILSQEPLDCRCRYLVRLAPLQYISSASLEPPQEDEVVSLGDFEVRVAMKNPLYPRTSSDRYIREWQPIPADLMVYVQRWIDERSHFYDELIEEARVA